MLALIKNGEFISQYTEGSRIDLDGLTIMPAQGGWEFAHFSPAEYEDVFDDESQEYIQIETKESEFIANYELHEINDGEETPEGFYIVSSQVQLVDGEWAYIHEFAKILTESPLDRTITKRQMLTVLLGMGLDAEPLIDAAIENIDDVQMRAQARTDWRYAGEFVRSHFLFNDPDMLALLDMNPDQVDALWIQATELPR